jgi:hypothetical protein
MSMPSSKWFGFSSKPDDKNPDDMNAQERKEYDQKRRLAVQQQHAARKKPSKLQQLREVQNALSYQTTNPKSQFLLRLFF